MWQRFTEHARKVVFLAQEEAAQLQNEVGVHFGIAILAPLGHLIGLVRGDDLLLLLLLLGPDHLIGSLTQGLELAALVGGDGIECLFEALAKAGAAGALLHHAVGGALHLMHPNVGAQGRF